MSSPGRVIFITGTDTGVGKTLLTGMLLTHLRQDGCRAAAIKPFCSGGRGDVKLLRVLQGGEISAAEINPFYCPEPLAPLVSARRRRRAVTLDQVVGHIRRMAGRCEVLLVEGAGGLLAPLGEGYSAEELIRALGCEVILVARNRLGTVNHTLLTIRVLRQGAGRGRPKLRGVALMGVARPDLASGTNPRLLAELVAPTPLVSVPFLGRGWGASNASQEAQKKFQKALAAEKSLRILCRLVLCDTQTGAGKKF